MNAAPRHVARIAEKIAGNGNRNSQETTPLAAVATVKAATTGLPADSYFFGGIPIFCFSTIAATSARSFFAS